MFLDLTASMIGGAGHPPAIPLVFGASRGALVLCALVVGAAWAVIAAWVTAR
jgi:hypothetical protein